VLAEIGNSQRGPIVFTPFHEGFARRYRFRGRLEIGRLIGGAIDVVRGICTPESTGSELGVPTGFRD